jgi:gamma-glutamyl-gamma-aminobutyrate hydrolase PuuD
MRDMREMFIYHIARQLGIPLFGFCRGHQFIAAMNGAELVQDILDDLMCYHAGGTHTVEVVNPDWDEFFKNSPFGPYTVSSTHHQCVHRDRLPVGSELLCVASDENAIVEALLYPAFGLTMQCHPEFSDWTAPIEWVADNFLA